MRIRKHLPPLFPSHPPPVTDPQLHLSAQTYDQQRGTLNLHPDQNFVIGRENNIWGFPKNDNHEAKMQEKEITRNGSLKDEENQSNGDDMRRIINISDELWGNKTLVSLSPSAQEMKSKAEKENADTFPLEAKKGKRGNEVMEGSRCSRANGQGWRCSQPPFAGYSMCEYHHLGKGRLRNISKDQLQSCGESGKPGQQLTLRNKRRKVVKARSVSNL